MTRPQSRSILAFGLSSLLWLAFAIPAASQTILYDVEEIAAGRRPTLNDDGDMAWERTNEVWFYDYSTDTETLIAGPANATGSPAINNAGVVAYNSDGNVFLYDSTTSTTSQLTTGASVSQSPKINDNGDVAYVNQGDGSGPDEYEIFLYVASSGATINVSNDSVWQRYFDLNDAGDVVFLRGGPCGTGPCGEATNTQVWLYDRSAGTRTQITTESIIKVAPHINNLGDIGWQTFDVSVFDEILNEVNFRDGGTGVATAITDASVRSQSLTRSQTALNDSGDFAMMAAAGTNGFVTDIYLYDAASGQEVLVDDYIGGQPVNPEPVINSDGWIAWADQGIIHLAIPRECTPEICDGLDNDCNGMIDDGIADQQTGSDIGECQVEIQSCIGGSFQVIQTGITPTAEICDGLDNDCNGENDNGVADIQTGTDVGECQVEIQSCIGGTFTVVQTGAGPTSEICDGLDNDCDGSNDNGIADQQTGTDVGECQVEIQSCVGGTFTIVQTGIGPSTEICDALDNDCNGVDDVTQGICNTPPSPDPTQFSDPSGNATLEFPDVAVGGDTTIQEIACGVNVPDGYTLNTAATCYEIESDADSSTGLKTVCIRFPNNLSPAPTAILKCESAGAQNCCAVSLNGTQNSCTDGTQFLSLGTVPPPPPDTFEVCLSVTTLSDFAFAALNDALDSDFDSVPDVSDNCPDDFNPLQEDDDADGRGDLCDNCSFASNGVLGGTCTDGDTSLLGMGCSDNLDCGAGGLCSQGQQDEDVDDVGDACDPAIVPFFVSEVLETPACYFGAGCTPADFPLDWGPLRTYEFGVPPGDPIYNGLLKGTWGGSVFTSSAPVDVYLEGVLVTSCVDTDPCWDPASTVDWNEGRGFLLSNLGINFSDPATRALFEDGDAELSFVQNDEISVHVSNLELELFTVPEPSGRAGLLVGGLGLLALYGRRARSQQRGSKAAAC